MIIIIGGAPAEEWGLIPDFLDDDDPRSAKEQFNDRYVAGWEPFEGFTFDVETGMLSYPGDPPMKPISIMLFRQELILLFDFAWVMIVQPDKSWEICRMD
jgi:hypothetical protein